MPAALLLAPALASRAGANTEAAGQWSARGTTPPPDAEAVVATARGFLGYPYVYGGEGQYGFDCSGFVQAVFAEHGYELPRSSSLQAGVGTPVPWDQVQAGDLLFFAAAPGGARISHVGVAIDDSRMIHASTGRGEVVIDPFAAGHYSARRVQARRLLDMPPGRVAGAGGDVGDSSSPTGPRGSRSVAPAASAPAGQEPREPAPPGFAPVPRPGLWHRGPVSLMRAWTAAGVRVGAALVESRGILLVAPQLTLRHEGLDVEGVLQAPLAAHVSPWRPAWRYSAAADFLRLIGSVRGGDPEGRAYLEASRTLSITVGQGILVNGSTPAVALPSLAGLPMHGPLAAAGRLALGSFEVQLAADDVVAPSVLAVLGGYGASTRGRVSVAVDPTAPGRDGPSPRTGVALEAEAPLASGPRFLASADAAAAALATARLALGLQGGVWLKWRDGPSEYALRAALRLSDPGFIPGVFGLDYRYLRGAGLEGEPLWDELDALALRAPWRWGFEFTGRITITRRFGVRLLYADDARLARDGAHLPARCIEAGLLARDVWVPWLGWMLSGHLSYHQRLTPGLTRPLDRRNDREVLFLGLRAATGSYFSFGVQLAKRPRQGSTHLEGMVDLAAELPF